MGCDRKRTGFEICLSKLVKNVGCCELFYDSAQISMETRVAQTLSDFNSRQKKQVCKDLIIWRKPNQNYWSESNIPLCIIEWKHNLLKPDNADINWLISFTRQDPECFGIALNVDTFPNYSLQAVKIEKGNITDGKWINV